MGAGLFALIFLLLFIGLAVLYLLTLQNTLKAITPSNRATEPSSVWLMLIPVVNLIYQFFMYKNIDSSLKNEYNENNGTGRETEASFYTSLISAIPGLAALIINQVQRNSQVATLLYIVSFFAWIAYWIQINNHRKKIESFPKQKDNDSLIFND